MHELGIVFHVIKSVEKVAKENNITEIASVTLELGQVSGVIPSYMDDCWKWAIKKTEYCSTVGGFRILINALIRKIWFCFKASGIL